MRSTSSLQERGLRGRGLIDRRESTGDDVISSSRRGPRWSALWVGALGFICLSSVHGAVAPLFDLHAIRDPSTLEIRVVQDWTVAPKHPEIRQKLIEITVCEWWAGQKVRLPVTLCAPATGGPCTNMIVTNMAPVLKPALPTGAVLRLLKEHRVGVVLVGMSTIDAMPPKGRLHLGMKANLLRTKDPRFTPAWIWGMSDMRALTAALAEQDVFQPKRVIVTGASKRGVAAAISGIHDDRFTGMFPVVTPIQYNPVGVYVRGSALADEMAENAAFVAQLSPGPNLLGLPETTRTGLEEREQRRRNESISREEAEAAGWSREEMLAMNDRAWDACRITLHLAEVRRRGFEFFYQVGSNDNVSPGLLELGRAHPDFPIYIVPGGQHGGPPGIGYSRETPNQPECDENLLAFAVHHFKSARSLPGPPTITAAWNVSKHEVTVTAAFPAGVEPAVNRLSWCIDRHRPYTYAAEYDPWQSTEMSAESGNVFRAVVIVPESARHVDFISTHRHVENGLPFNISSAYQNIALRHGW